MALARFLGGVTVVPLDEKLGRRAGALLAKTRSSDVIDAALVLVDADGDVILSSDLGELKRLAETADPHVDLVDVEPPSMRSSSRYALPVAADRITLNGLVEAPPEILTAPFSGTPCVAYAVTVLDESTGELLSADKDGLPFELVDADGTRWEIDPRRGKLEGFERASNAAGPGGASFAGPLKIPANRAVRILEQHVARGDTITVEGRLVDALVIESAAYRSTGARATKRLAPDVLRGSYRGAEPEPKGKAAWGLWVALAVVIVIVAGMMSRAH